MMATIIIGVYFAISAILIFLVLQTNEFEKVKSENEYWWLGIIIAMMVTPIVFMYHLIAATIQKIKKTEL